MYKLLVLACTLPILVLSCTSKSKTPSDAEAVNTVSEKTFSIIGKRATIEYPQLKAEVHYTSESTLHWKTTDPQNKISEGDEKISYKQITDNQFFINWIEKNGLTISQVLDITKGKVYVYMSFSDKSSERGQRSARFMEEKLSFN